MNCFPQPYIAYICLYIAHAQGRTAVHYRSSMSTFGNVDQGGHVADDVLLCWFYNLSYRNGVWKNQWRLVIINGGCVVVLKYKLKCYFLLQSSKFTNQLLIKIKQSLIPTQQPWSGVWPCLCPHNFSDLSNFA